MKDIEEYELFLKTEKKLGDNTIESYLLDLMSFLKWFNGDVRTTTKEDILNYISFLRENLNEKSINRHISSLKSFYLYLLDMNYIKIKS